MIKLDKEHLLFIEPGGSDCLTPVHDEVYRAFADAWARREKSGHAYKGVHFAQCGATSDNRDYWVTLHGVRYKTHMLASHYLACHRDEVPASEIAKIMGTRIEEDADCPFPECDGTLTYQDAENCSCHINPPCGACTSVVLECVKCGWVDDDD